MEVVPILALVAGAGALAGLLLVDLRQARLPDALNLALALAALVFHLANGSWYATWTELLAGAVFGAGLFYALRALMFRLRGIEALGLGDVKFMGAAGLWVGIWGIAPLILVATLSTLAVVALWHGRGLADREIRRQRIPFGPGLVFGLVAVMAGRLSGFWVG